MSGNGNSQDGIRSVRPFFIPACVCVEVLRRAEVLHHFHLHHTSHSSFWPNCGCKTEVFVNKRLGRMVRGATLRGRLAPWCKTPSACGMSGLVMRIKGAARMRGGAALHLFRPTCAMVPAAVSRLVFASRFCTTGLCITPFLRRFGGVTGSRGEDLLCR